ANIVLSVQKDDAILNIYYSDEKVLLKYTDYDNDFETFLQL
ncbi:11169_t:CDS:1, partial [Dentiscutata erythropus]